MEESSIYRGKNLIGKIFLLRVIENSSCRNSSYGRNIRWKVYEIFPITSVTWIHFELWKIRVIEVRLYLQTYRMWYYFLYFFFLSTHYKNLLLLQAHSKVSTAILWRDVQLSILKSKTSWNAYSVMEFIEANCLEYTFYLIPKQYKVVK
jgi:hypothetical protein